MATTPVSHLTDARGSPEAVPIAPRERYPEFGSLPAGTDPSNRVYAGVRELLRALGYDRDRFGTPA